LIVIGPKDLPKVLRTCGQWVRKARELAGEFQRGVDDMVRDSELHDLKKQVEKAADVNALKREIEQTIDPAGDIARSLEAPKLDAAPQEAAPADDPVPTSEKPAIS
jgi:sec-independent protein translocase protein TatB